MGTNLLGGGVLWGEEGKIIDDVKVAVCPECGNIEMYLENLTNLKD